MRETEADHRSHGQALARPSLRTTARQDDPDAIRALTAATGFFSQSEVDVAVELVETALRAGPASGYWFLFAERRKRVCGYTCYGPVPCTQSSFDLYWIVVDAASQGQGIGRHLLNQTERLIHKAGGRRIYAETSSRRQYRPTRTFYCHTGFRQVARLKEFYAPGDDKVVYCKLLQND
jgi:ribosomal protein S18 acetylase RimI-like enzyme